MESKLEKHTRTFMIQCSPATDLRFQRLFSRFLFLFAVAWMFSSCRNDETDIGLDLLPSNGSIYGTVADTFTVESWTIKADSTRTDSLSTNLLGAFNDPVFGKASARLYFQLQLPEVNLTFGSAPVLDSVVLILKYGLENSVGNRDHVQKLSVYRLSEDMKPQDAYYQNASFTTSDKLGEFNGSFSTKDSVLAINGTDSTYLAPQMRIRLDNAFGQELLQASGSVFSSKDAFLNWLKGIAILPESGSLSAGQGAIVNVSLVNSISGLKVYYNQGESKLFSITAESDRVQGYDFPQRSSELQNQLGMTSIPRTTSYVQSMAGAKAFIRIPHLMNLVADGRKTIVHEASITFYPVSGTISSDFPAPYRMLFYAADSVNQSNRVITDLADALLPPAGWSGYTNYGGFYNSSLGGVTFRFNRHLQEMLDTYLEKGVDVNKGFTLTIPSDFPLSAYRMLIDNSKTKVRIVYNKL